MFKYLIYIVLAVSGFSTFALAQFSDELLSIDLAPSPSNGNCLTTDGTDNIWGSCGTGGGGSETLWALNTSQNYVYSDSASTTATTSARSYYFTATSTSDNSVFPLFTSTQATITSASSTNFFSSILTATTAYLTNLFGTNATITAATTTNSNTTNLKVGSDTITDLTGAGLQVTSNALTLNATGDWTGTLDGYEGSALLGTSNWLYNGSRLSPSTTVGIGVFASSTIGDGTATGGLTVNGSATSTGTTTARTLNVGNNGLTAQSGIVEAAAWINASTSGRSGVIYQNYGGGTAPEFRFTIGDPYSGSSLEYLALGLTNSNAVTPGSLYGVSKSDLVYMISNTGRDMVIGSGTGDLHLGTNSSAAGLIQLDHATQRVLIGSVATSTPTSTLSVNGDIYYANSIATGTATSANVIATTLLRAPYGSAPTVVTNGDTGIDSTSNQFKYQANGSTYVLGNGTTTASFYYSTTTAWTGTTTIGLGPAPWAETWSAVRCRTDTGTVNVDFGDGTNYTNATTSVSANPAPRHALTSNNTFTAGERREVRMGTPASSPTSIACTVYKSITAD